ncbi:MAG: phospholipase D-like domain-containing protein [Oligoflexia bacterium]|nr:phospholipase D-like domain-containing protein [Oligoflexia bacterium]
MARFGITLFLALGSASILSSAEARALEIYFTPGKDCEDRIVSAIHESKKEVRAAVYSINNARIVEALRAAHRRGVKVHVLTDRVQAAGPSSRTLELFEAGVPLRVNSRHKIMHNKFAVFDGKLSVTGSYNWTAPASEVNSENCVFLSENAAVSAFRKRFDELWTLNTEAKSRQSLARIREKRRDRKIAREE